MSAYFGNAHKLSLDIPYKERAYVLTALFPIVFSTGGKRKTLQREMEKSVTIRF